MALGPGTYDELVIQLNEQLEADGILLVVFGGARGSGCASTLPLHLLATVPEILERIAHEIRKDIESLRQTESKQ